ncbi:MAG TPA: hypothetical protein PKC65_09440 [Pyrinomonadaceae bacterium]|nr:hypothetical protein [Pyrinomonadaceae bacterium]
MNTKTAISIPSDVFRLSEKLAKQLKISRSAVFALGVKRLSEEYDEEELIARINAACAEIDTSVDPTLKAYQAQRLKAKDL